MSRDPDPLNALRAEYPEFIEAHQELIAPGAPFEVVREDVLGEKMLVFKDRLPHLRAMLETARAHGDTEFIRFEDQRIGFDQFLRDVTSTACALRDRFGIEKGDRVAILAANRPEWLITWWAAVSLGAIGVGMNGWWVEDEIRFALDDCTPKLLVGDQRRLARLGGDTHGVACVEMESGFSELVSHAPDATLPDTPIAEDDPASILYTSGTTGRPKGVVTSHRSIVAVQRMMSFSGLRNLKAAMAMPRDDVLSPTPAAPPPRTVMLLSAPLFHLAGLYATSVSFLVNGLKLVMFEGRFEPERILQLIETEGVTTWSPMTAMLHRVARVADREKYDVSSMVNLGTGGEKTSSEMLRLMREVFPTARHSMSLGYGLTEHTSSITQIGGKMLDNHPASVGPALPTIELALRDENGASVPADAEGEIFARSPLVMLRYWNRPEATAETVSGDRWLRTGDIGHVDANGLLSIHSRARDMIIRGGENIYPVEIEQRLEAHPDVREVAVIGVDHPELGQEVKAVVVPESGAKMDPEALRSWVAEALAYFKVPSLWEERHEPLPRNATSKVVKSLLSDPGAESTFVEE